MFSKEMTNGEEGGKKKKQTERSVNAATAFRGPGEDGGVSRTVEEDRGVGWGAWLPPGHFHRLLLHDERDLRLRRDVPDPQRRWNGV